VGHDVTGASHAFKIRRGGAPTTGGSDRDGRSVIRMAEEENTRAGS